jgi:hypothetical protein
MFRLHDLDEAFRQRHGSGIALLAGLLQPQEHQRRDRCQHREAAVDRIRHGALYVPMRLASLGSDRAEQWSAALRRGR